MKRYLFCLLTVFCSATTISAQDFEGVLEFKTQDGATNEINVWYVKGDKVRIDYFEPGTRVLRGCNLVNTKDSSVQYLDHKAKTFAWNLDKIVPHGLPSGSNVEETKNTREILGYKATETVVNAPPETYSYWISPAKFSFFRKAISTMGPANNFMDYFLALDTKEGAMPMLVIRKNSAGKETGRFEVTRIEKRAVDDALFDVPADYKKQ